MRAKIQNRISRSVATLPLCAILAAGLWWFPQGDYSVPYLIGLILCVLTTYIVMETNSTFALLRVRSRMVSSTWLVMTGCIGLVHSFQPSLVAAFCLTVSHYLLFRTYQQHQPVTDVFHTFVMLGIGSIFVPQLVLIAPFYYWYLLVFMRTLTFRGFWAGLIGMALPFWFWGGVSLVLDEYQALVDWWQQLSTFTPILPDNYLAVDHTMAIVWGVIALLAVYTGLVYLNDSFNDKIRVRMMFYIYIFQSTLILTLVGLQPQHAATMLPLMLVSCCPFVAHYYTLTHTWWCTLMFWLSVLAMAALAVLTLTSWATPYIK